MRIYLCMCVYVCVCVCVYDCLCIYIFSMPVKKSKSTIICNYE